MDLYKLLAQLNKIMRHTGRKYELMDGLGECSHLYVTYTRTEILVTAKTEEEQCNNIRNLIECKQQQEQDDDEGICGCCSGSGEGMHDGERCIRCGGTGTDSEGSYDED